jgi:phosphoribosylformylglycinamidine synthase
VTVAESCVSGPRLFGAEIDLRAGNERADLLLFGEGPSRVVVSVRPESERHFEQLMGEFALPWRWIGRVGGEALVIKRGGTPMIEVSVNRMAHAWRSGFERHVA